MYTFCLLIPASAAEFQQSRRENASRNQSESINRLRLLIIYQQTVNPPFSLDSPCWTSRVVSWGDKRKQKIVFLSPPEPQVSNYSFLVSSVGTCSSVHHLRVRGPQRPSGTVLFPFYLLPPSNLCQILLLLLSRISRVRLCVTP